MKKYFISVLVSFMAVSGVQASDWSEPTKVTEINAGYKEKIILFKTEKVHNNPGECAADFYAVTEADADVDIILSILLAAQRSGSLVQIGVDATKCAGVSHANTRINVTRVRSL